MHAPRSFLLTPLLALLALTPSIAATPTPKGSEKRSCPFTILPVDDTIDGTFTLTAISDTLPLQSWWVAIGRPSAQTPKSPFLTRTKIAPSLFTLTGGSLNTTGSNGVSYPARFVPTVGLEPFQQLVFGGSGDPTYAYSTISCDATETGYTQLILPERGAYLFELACDSCSRLFSTFHLLSFLLE